MADTADKLLQRNLGGTVGRNVYSRFMMLTDEQEARVEALLGAEDVTPEALEAAINAQVTLPALPLSLPGVSRAMIVPSRSFMRIQNGSQPLINSWPSSAEWRRKRRTTGTLRPATWVTRNPRRLLLGALDPPGSAR